MKTLRSSSIFRLLLVAVLLGGATPSRATEITLRNGTRLSGVVGKITGLAQDPTNPDPTGGQITVSQIVLVDDEIRRVFVPSKQVAARAEGEPVVEERIRIPQRVPISGRRINVIGAIYAISEFDEYGRRIFSMAGPKGRLDLVQGITEVTPRYCKVECLQGKDAYVWTQYVATSSIPREKLSRILMRHIDPRNANDRMRIVTLYIQAERFKEARIELEQIIEDFPTLKDKKKQVAQLRQQSARRLIREIELRQRAGQHRLAYTMLNQFPEDGVAGETLLRVREMLQDYEKRMKQGDKVLELLDTHFEAMTDEAAKADLQPTIEEIRKGLSLNTLDRMSDYLRLADDTKMGPGEKLSLAVSGWILGAGSATENLAVSADLLQVRDAVVRYLNTDNELDRASVLEQLRSLEGGTPNYVSKILANLAPPKVTTEESNKPGFYELTTPGLSGEGDITYYVQLPPEYDPNRRYPCIVTLNGSATSPEQQIDWWAGDYIERINLRVGQAARHGYIVIAPKWSKDRQRRYNFSAQEHAAVLYSLSDAMRRCSIDSDRVFLSGHSMGGDAAWDIGLAHPDIWAGVIPIVATTGRYITRYWENGRGLPMYFVAGEMDGRRLKENAIDLDRYLTKVGYDCTVVEYKGRGHEHFSDELQYLFDWMRVQERQFTKREFKTVTMRPWDNYFWWVELGNFPVNSIVPPATWPNTRAKPAVTEARIIENNIFVKSAADAVTVFLTPDMVDFSQRILINVNRRGKTAEVRPDVAVMLEDARTRGDRKHPFWAKVDR